MKPFMTFRSVVAVAIASMALAPAAFAASSSTQGYGGPGGSTQTAIDPGGAPGTGTASQLTTPRQSSQGNQSNLAFTGSDVLLVALMGGGLVATGFGLRRLSLSRQ
jgi:hypothetical protein